MPTRYVLETPQSYRIQDAPEEQTPYQRLSKDGAPALSMQELFAIASGNSQAILQRVQEYGIHSLIALHTVEEVQHSLHLSEEEASRLLVAIEIGKRLYSRSYASLLQIKGIEDVVTHYRSMATLPKEQLRALLINSRYQLIHEEVLGVGSIESLHITAKDVFQAAVERRVTAIILVHNHPSGDASPSKSDYEFTQVMKNAAELLGIQLLDHIIIAEGGFASCMPTG